ncbi:MAG: DUF6259 domain-containing protein [Planctomycetota bacterium]
MHTTRNFIYRIFVLILCFTLAAIARRSHAAVQSGQNLPGCWPQEYSVQRDDTSGLLTLSTPYYTVQHNLKRGGAITKIKYTHGRVGNLLVRPFETSVQNETGIIFNDINSSTARISHTKTGKTEFVTSQCTLADENGQESGIRVKTTYEYHWGYIRIRREFHFPADAIKNLSVLSTVFDPSLSDYGYREGITEQEGAGPFSFGVCHWGKVKAGAHSDQPLKASHVPRYLVLANQGIEGIEWFVSSDLSQWDFQLTGQRGNGLCNVGSNLDPPGVAVSIYPLNLPQGSVAVKGVYRFDYYIGMPILEGHANKPWLHRTFNRNKGKWLVEEEIKQLAESGIITVHCHNDGDYYQDGLFWRDGSYPPYPTEDMEEFDRVIETCHSYGIEVATYFSNKELHPTTESFKKHGEEWGRKDNKGNLKHNYYRGGISEFGAQMCLKSGWLDFLKFSIDRVLKNHDLDGVYYDWNVALLCSNPSHVGKNTGGISAGKAKQAPGHWDMDELIELMEWTRQRVGPDGLIIVHNTKVPMFVTENFANYVVAMEWGYQKWSKSTPKLQELPLEWDFVGARSRGVIGYGLIDQNAPRRLHKLLALETLLTGVAPWPASPEAIELYKILRPLGNVEQYKFEDWQNKAVTLVGDNCASAVYSRPGETFILLANLDIEPKKVTCAINPRHLPYPLSSLSSGKIRSGDKSVNLNIKKITGDGADITVPGDGAVLVHIK